MALSAAPLAHRLLGHPCAFIVVSPLLHLLLWHLLPLSHPLVRGAWLLVAVGMPLLYSIVRGPTVWIKNSVSIECCAPAPTCSRFLREGRNLKEYEQKVTGCSVWDRRPGGCMFALWGWWWGLPWCKQFAMRHNKDGGFHAALHEGGWQRTLPAWVRFRGGGGFSLRPSATGAAGAMAGTPTVTTTVTHYERYGWPVVFPLVWLLDAPWNAWHRRGMEVEMEVIKTQVEALRRREEAVKAGGGGPCSAAVEDADPPGTWTRWKYGAHHYVGESVGGCGGGTVHHPQVVAAAAAARARKQGRYS